jgi:2-oxoisovalerate dehydrogenase E1 component alpha subunit
MASDVLDEAGDAEIADAAMREVDEATDLAEAAPLPDPATFYDHVYAD